MPKIGKASQQHHIDKPKTDTKKKPVKSSIGKVEDLTASPNSKILDIEAKSSYLIQTLTKVSDFVRYAFGPL